MKRTSCLAGAWMTALMLAGSLLVAIPAQAHRLGVELWTDRGNDAVYQPGDVLQVRARTTDDSYLLVYEIDSEGYVRLLFPVRGQNGMVSARETYRVPPADAEQQLVVQNPTGQDFIVAIAAPGPFEDLPWYLRPYDLQGDNVGYVNEPKEEDGMTSEGKIVGDPFVAMERIRRRVLPTPTDAATFATAYTTYYVHEQVRYPRYICNDCHRQGSWAWWDGWDPYYTHCSVVDFRVNWSWGWGPNYWCGFVPYYVYVYRPDCPPRWHNGGNVWYSSWDGCNRWNQLWGGPLVRYKSPPPQGYTPPLAYRDWRGGTVAPPPGFVVSGVRRGGSIGSGPLPIGRNRPSDEQRPPSQPGVSRQPGARAPQDDGGAVSAGERRERGAGGGSGPGVTRMPARPGGGQVSDRDGREAPSHPGAQHTPPVPTRHEPPHSDSRGERPQSTPHAEKSHDNGSTKPAPAHESHGEGNPRSGRGGP